MSRARVVLNSPEIACFLSSDDDVAKAVKSEARKVKEAMPGALEETRAKASSDNRTRVTPVYDQKITFEEGAANDGRLAFRVGVDGMGKSDFLFGTISRAITGAGGSLSRRRRR